MMFCEQCGNMMSDNAKFCGKCGHRVEEKKPTCPSCGTEYERGQVYCEQCGAKLAEVQTESVTTETIEKPTEPGLPPTPAYVADFEITGDMTHDVATLSARTNGELSYAQIQQIVMNLYSGKAPMSGVGEIKVSPESKAPFNLNSFQITGNKIQDINRLRQEAGGMSLQEAKDIIDKKYANQNPISVDNQQSQQKVRTNSFICQSPTVSWYKGDKALGSSSTNGILKLYGDRLEFVSTFSTGFLFGAATPGNMSFDDISSITKGRYVMGSSILVTLKDGQKHTFASLNSKLYDFLAQVVEQMG